LNILLNILRSSRIEIWSKKKRKRNSFLSSWCELYRWRKGEGRYQSHG